MGIPFYVQTHGRKKLFTLRQSIPTFGIASTLDYTHNHILCTHGRNRKGDSMYTRYSSINRILAWNSLDAIITQTALLSFEYALTYGMGAEFHGTFGSAMSLLYIIAAFINFGFDSNIAAYYAKITQNRSATLTFVATAWLPHMCWVLLIAWYIYTYHITDMLEFSMHNAYFVWILVLCIEAFRKTAKHITRYAGYVTQAAIIEVSATVGYITCVSLGLMAGFIYTIKAILYIHAASAFLQCCGLMFYLIYHTTIIPHTGEQVFAPAQFHMHRIFVGINEVAGTLYTGNFLIPLIAYSLGYEFASVFRLTAYTAQWFVLCIRQIFATTGGIVLSQQKSRSIEQRKATFIKLTYYMHQVLYAGIAFVLIHSWWFFMPMNMITISPIEAVGFGCILFALTIVDVLCAFYLRWYIVEEQAHRIALFNVISVLGMDVIIRMFDLGDIPMVAAMLGMRMIAYVMILVWSVRIWDLRPSLRWSWPSILTACSASLTWYVVRMFL